MHSDSIPQCHILAIPGSLRRDSLNLRLLRAAAILAPPGVVITVYEDFHAIPLFNEDLEPVLSQESPLSRLGNLVKNAHAVLISTPEYNQSMPGVLKNLLDWLSRPCLGNCLESKPVALIGATAGRWGTRLAQAALRQTLFAVDSVVLTGPALCLAGAAAAFNASGELVDANAQRALHSVLLGLQQLAVVRPTLA